MFPALLLFLLASSAMAQISYDVRGQQQLTPPSPATRPDLRCTVAGRITNSLTGEPVKKAILKLTLKNIATYGRSRGEQGYAALSDVDGAFRFENVEPGTYLLAANRNGYLNGQYGARGPDRPGTEIPLVAAQQLANLAFPLTPQSVITGKVVDDDGDPVSNVSMQALSRRWTRGKPHYVPTGAAQTNDIGEFRMSNLSPGRYYLSAYVSPSLPSSDQTLSAGKPDIRPIRTFFPEATALENATPLEIKAGQDLPGIDVRLHSAQTYHVRGRIVPSSGDKDDGLMVGLQPRAEANFVWGQDPGRVRKDRTFDIPGIPPGSYTLSVFSIGGRMRSLARQALDVGAADVNDVAVTLYSPGPVRGQVRVEGSSSGAGAPSLENLRISLTAEDGGTFFNGGGFAEVKDDGTFTVQNVLPGRYFVNAAAPAGTYLASLRVGSQELSGNALEISQGGLGDVQIVFRYGVAEVAGTVLTADSNSATPVASATVVLHSESDLSDGSGLHIATSGKDGSFSLRQLSPGHYRAYAIEDADSSSLQDPDVLKQLESSSVELELKENDRKQLQLTIIPAETYTQILARLGDAP